MRSPQLQSAIQQVYAEFRSAKPSAIEGCPCCTASKDACRLLAKDLHDLTARDLSPYGVSLFLTVGDEPDFQYFLPRLLEIAATEDWWPSPPILLEKLKLAHWQTWPATRRAAVKRVIDVWFAECLDSQPTGSDIDDMLCGIARADLALDEYLEVLAKRPDELRAFFAIHAQAFFKRGRLADGLWKDHTVGELAVLDFFDTPAVREQLGH